MTSLCQSKRETRHSKREIDSNRSFDRKRLQGDRTTRSTEQEIGTDADANAN